MSKSLGLNRVPTLDPEGDQEYPSYAYVRNLVRALNANFEILNSAYGGSRQDTTDLGTLYEDRVNLTAIGAVHTTVCTLTLPAGLWLVRAVGAGVDTAGGRQIDAQLYDATAALAGHTVNIFVNTPYRIPFALMNIMNLTVESTIRLRGLGAAANTFLDNNVLWAHKVQEVL